MRNKIVILLWIALASTITTLKAQTIEYGGKHLGFMDDGKAKPFFSPEGSTITLTQAASDYASSEADAAVLWEMMARASAHTKGSSVFKVKPANGYAAAVKYVLEKVQSDPQTAKTAWGLELKKATDLDWTRERILMAKMKDGSYVVVARFAKKDEVILCLNGIPTLSLFCRNPFYVEVMGTTVDTVRVTIKEKGKTDTLIVYKNIYKHDTLYQTVYKDRVVNVPYQNQGGGSAGSWGYSYPQQAGYYQQSYGYSFGWSAGMTFSPMPPQPCYSCYTPPAPCCGGYYPPSPAPVPPAPVPVDPPYHGGGEPRSPRNPGNTGYTGGAEEPANPGDYAGGGDNGNQGNGAEPGNPGSNGNNGYGGGGKMAPRNPNASGVTTPNGDRSYTRQPATAPASPRGDVRPNADRGLTARPTSPREPAAAPAVGTGRRKPGQLQNIPGRNNTPRTAPAVTKDPVMARPTGPREAVTGNRTATSPSGDRGATRKPATATSPRGGAKPTGRTPRIQNDDVAPRSVKSPEVAPRGNTGRTTGGGRTAAPAARAPRQVTPRQQAAPRQTPAMGPRGGGGGRTAPTAPAMGPRKH